MFIKKVVGKKYTVQGDEVTGEEDVIVNVSADREYFNVDVNDN